MSNLIKTQSFEITKLRTGAPFQFLCHKTFKHANPCAPPLACSIDANQGQIKTHALDYLKYGDSENRINFS